MNVKTMSPKQGMKDSDLAGIFYDEARRISLTEEEAVSLAREAFLSFRDHYKALKLKTTAQGARP